MAYESGWLGLQRTKLGGIGLGNVPGTLTVKTLAGGMDIAGTVVEAQTGDVEINAAMSLAGSFDTDDVISIAATMALSASFVLAQEFITMSLEAALAMSASLATQKFGPPVLGVATVRAQYPATYEVTRG